MERILEADYIAIHRQMSDYRGRVGEAFASILSGIFQPLKQASRRLDQTYYVNSIERFPSLRKNAANDATTYQFDMDG